jgi:plasmid stabilization system protein ParE
MMRDYEFTARAIRDITTARDWYDRHGNDLGNRFVDSVVSAIREAREHPQRFPEIEPGIRSAGCVGFPFRVYYELKSDDIIIRAVYHTARNPEKWDDKQRE